MLLIRRCVRFSVDRSVDDALNGSGAEQKSVRMLAIPNVRDGDIRVGNIRNRWIPKAPITECLREDRIGSTFALAIQIAPGSEGREANHTRYTPSEDRPLTHCELDGKVLCH